MSGSPAVEDRSLLSKIVKDTSHPIKLGARLRKAESSGKKIGLATVAVSAVEDNTKFFTSSKVEVAIICRKSPEAGSFRDVDVVVRKGPAVVGIEMTDESGKKNGSSFVLEFDSAGKVKKTMPDFDNIKMDRIGERGVAYVETNGKKSILPFSEEKIKSIQIELAERVKTKKIAKTSKSTRKKQAAPMSI